jgi:hypothetical protein
MIGKLVITFCERSAAGPPKALELWSFPDGTLNIVVASDSEQRQTEWSFPCAIEQLQSVLFGKPLILRDSEDRPMQLARVDDRICATYSAFGENWRQCIDVVELQQVFGELLTSAA